MDLRLRQADLARECGISPSYLNLIEHNRRRIGGKLLVDIARRLQVDPAILSEGASAARLQALREAAAAQAGLSVEMDRAEDFAGRFPGWAQLVSLQSERVAELERTIETLSDRLAHDPYLSASLHDVLSTVTAIRSTSAILADEEEIAPDWQARFHRNLYEDSQRLAETSQALVNYLDAGADTSRDIRAPQDEVDSWLAAHAFHFPALETAPEAADDGYEIARIIDAASELKSSIAKELGANFLERYQQDAASLPMERLVAALGRGPINPGDVAAETGAEVGVVLRRLATLPPDVVSTPIGLVICDGAGAFVLRKETPGFPLPRFGAGCPLWPLYQALVQPMVPVAAALAQPGTPERRFRAYAISQPRGAVSFGRPVVQEATMLILPEAQGEARDALVPVGPTCRICPRDACAARREPSILSG